jgi:hypothetical protein
MQKPTRPGSSFPVIHPPQSTDEGYDIPSLVEEFFGILERHDAQASEGVLSLLTALMQAADRVMELSTPEEAEDNRAELVAMIEHARSFVESWPSRTPSTWRVH